MAAWYASGNRLTSNVHRERYSPPPTSICVFHKKVCAIDENAAATMHGGNVTVPSHIASCLSGNVTSLGRCVNVPQPICNVPWPICNTPQPICNVSWSVCNTHQSICNVPWSICDMPQPICGVPQGICKRYFSKTSCFRTFCSKSRILRISSGFRK